VVNLSVMPSERSNAQGAGKTASVEMYSNFQASRPGAALASKILDPQKSEQSQQQQVTQQKIQRMQKHFAHAVSNSPKLIRKRLSHESASRSVSTDEGSSSDGESSSHVRPNRLSFNSPVSPNSTKKTYMPMLSDVVGDAPLWLDNGLKEDKAAWLLVLSKHPTGGCAAAGLKSPKDAVLLGPYVTTKNTFLVETRVNDAIMDHRRTRSKSWGPCRVAGEDGREVQS